MVGDDEARRIDDDAGAERLRRGAARVVVALVAEELAEDGVVEDGVARLPLDGARGVNIDDSGLGLFHDG